MTIPITIWSDVACPWCFIGKRRLERALLKMDKLGRAPAVSIQWRAFELDPSPKDPHDRTPYVERLSRKYSVSIKQAQTMIDNMVQTGLTEQIHFDFDHAVPANTFDTHRLIQWAFELDQKAITQGAQGRLKEAFMRAHLEQGRNLGLHNELLSVVASQALNVKDAEAVLNSDDFAAVVRNDEKEAHANGISGVPFFVRGRFGISGAQDPDTLIQVIERIQNQQTPSTSQASRSLPDDDHCSTDGCG